MTNQPIHRCQRMALSVALGAAAAVSTFIATPARAMLPDADKKILAEMALQWALDGGISDVKLMKDPSHLVVANFNLSKDMKLELPGRSVNLASLLFIQAQANRTGDFLYFRFNRLDGTTDNAKVAIALVWAVAENSGKQYLSGGGATLDFVKRDGKWQLQPVMNRWMS